MPEARRKKKPARTEQAEREADERDDSGAGLPKAFWSGTLSFGLVSIPVDLYPADRPGGVHARWLSKDGVPLTRRYFCPEHDAEVPSDQLVRGYATQSGDYVTITDEELQALDPEKTTDISLHLFVDRDSLDPLYFERGYFLGFGASSAKAYGLLAAVMQRTHKAGIATFVLRDKAHVVAIFADHGLLSAQTLRFYDEVRSADNLELASSTPSSELVERLVRLIQKHASRAVDLRELHDADREAVEALIAKKAKQRKNVIELEPEPTESGEKVVDLMKMLKESLSRAQNTNAAPHVARGKRRSAK